MTTTLITTRVPHTNVSRAARTTQTLSSATSWSTEQNGFTVAQLPGIQPEVRRGLHQGNSNTRGQGRAIVPSRSVVRRSQRVAAPHLSMFDNGEDGVWQRWSKNAEKFATSTGGMLVAATTIVLSMGLSPLFL